MGKIPPGILQGNINWPGSIESCNDVPSTAYFDFYNIPLKGKYCRAQIGFPIEQVAVI